MSKSKKARPAPTHQEIAAGAYHIYEQESRPDGRDSEHWLAAEAQLSSKGGEHARPAVPAASS